METQVWDDQLGHRSRRSWLLVIDQQSTLHLFSGENIPGVLVVVGSDYVQKGKWSHTTYRFVTSPGVRVIAGHNGWETGRFTEGLHAATKFERPIDRWEDVAEALGVSVDEAMRFLRAFRPQEAEYLDEVEAALAALQ